MSSMTTPIRARPAVVIPGIDTRAHLDGKVSMMSLGGLPTPPQSALESRRPSLQYSTLAEAPYSAVSSNAAFSQPATPIRGLTRHSSFSQPWSDHVATTNNTPSNLAGTYATGYGNQPQLQSAFQPQFSYQATTTDSAGIYADNTNTHPNQYYPHVNSPAEELWSPSHHVQQVSTAHTSNSLGPTLFAMSHGLSVEDHGHDTLSLANGTIYDGQHYPSQPMGSFQGYGGPVNGVFPQPQVIVPSQLSPHDEYTEEQYHTVPSPQQGIEGYSTSFRSSSDALSGYELVRAPSPDEKYFAPSDDEDFTHVKFERYNSPTYNASLRRYSTSRPQRRSSKRNRTRTPGRSQYLYRHVVGETEVMCEWDPVNGPPPRPSDTKPHRCTHVLENGVRCESRFERSEHLKRHVGSHSSIKNFPCPVPQCNKEIQRPDNAGDHFKTHLRPKSKGKRNENVSWTFLRNAIFTTYGDKKRANKLLDNLQKWVDAGMPPSSGSRRLT